MTSPFSASSARVLALCAVAVLGGGCAPATPTAPSAFAITTSAGLVPAYNPQIPDYTVPCGPSGTVTVKATVLPGQSLSINGGPALSGETSTLTGRSGGRTSDRVRQTIPLVAGQAFTFTPKTASDTSTHTVRCTPADFPAWSVSRNGSPQVRWIALGPSDGSGSSPGGGGHYAVIVDGHGVPVWWMRDPSGRLIDNVSVLPDGEVAWWVPTGAGGGQDGYYQISDLDGTSPLGRGHPEHITSSPADGHGEVGANLHDFSQLPNGDFLLLATVPRSVRNLAVYGDPRGGPGTVIDAVIQEVTPAGRLVWSWDSAHHIAPGATAWAFASHVATWKRHPAYDIVHMNSVQVVDRGGCLGAAPTAHPTCNLVFSARYLDAVYEINMASGRIVWKLGTAPGVAPTAKNLRFVGDPDGNFSGQHDARILPDGTLTVYDNGSLAARPPRAVHYAIDTINMTATYLGGVSDPAVSYSNCCGGATLLPGGDWLVSWGATPLVSELTPAGRPALSLRFASGSTYRAYAVPDSAAINYRTLTAGMNAAAIARG